MRYASGSAIVESRTSENRKPSRQQEFCPETGERWFHAGEYVAPGKYIEIERGRCITLETPDFLPARLDGHAACYQLARQGSEETAGQTLVQRQSRFHVLAARTRKPLYNFVRRHLDNAQDAEDMTQEVFTRAWNYFETFDPRRSFDAWVFRIAQNLLIDQSRRRSRRQGRLPSAPAAELEEKEDLRHAESADSVNLPEKSLLAKELRAEMQSALRSLPPAYQETLLLVAREHTYEQIARHFDCPVGTVRSRVYRARVLMRRNLKSSPTLRGKDAEHDD